MYSKQFIIQTLLLPKIRLLLMLLLLYFSLSYFVFVSIYLKDRLCFLWGQPIKGERLDKCDENGDKFVSLASKVLVGKRGSLTYFCQNFRHYRVSI